ncbi:MAG: hypothetical protein A2428_04050 [Bdellovibrionales bacterium RIFOXYC1_FULL_54_43]|nr:MAG: hypothetical protein A2428_04050 [Bdellovibrionales bacterium RIFOXYC1_FULL_54_43]OFZ78618.1 MAG: hypothetical protein A2603_02330 [Bdellovibrionales bacterium RIFOXYD1_FULL_55_31]
MRTHEKQKRRTWRKLHITINPAGIQIVVVELTEANTHDDSVVPALLQNQTITGKVHADGADISKTCFDAIVGKAGFLPIRLLRRNQNLDPEHHESRWYAAVLCTQTDNRRHAHRFL